jgi:hypothetical protein
MTLAPRLDLLKLALRGQVCIECSTPTHSITRSAPAIAECEGACPLFVNLPRLARVVQEGEPPGGYEIFTKSLQPFPGDTPGPDVVHALTVLETAASVSVEPQGADATGCKRLARIATEVACLHQPTNSGERNP